MDMAAAFTLFARPMLTAAIGTLTLHVGLKPSALREAATSLLATLSKPSNKNQDWL